MSFEIILSSVITYDPLDADVPNRVLSFARAQVAAPLSNTLSNPDMSAVYVFNTDTDLVPRKYWLANVDQNSVVAMSAQQMTLVDQHAAAATLAGERATAEADIASSQDFGKVERAAVDILEGVINNQIFAWMAAVQTAVAASTNLANFQSRMAQIPTPSNLTLAQAKSAIVSDIASGGEGD